MLDVALMPDVVSICRASRRVLFGRVEPSEVNLPHLPERDISESGKQTLEAKIGQEPKLLSKPRPASVINTMMRELNTQECCEKDTSL